MSGNIREQINKVKNFTLNEEFFDLNNDYKKSLNNDYKNSLNDKIDFTKSPLIINDGRLRKGFNQIYLNDNEVGSFVIHSKGVFKDIHIDKVYDNSIFLQGGFLIKNDFKYKGIGKETINIIFNKTGVDNIFLYSVDWQGGVDFWKKIGGVVIFRNDEKQLNLIKIKNPKNK